MSIGSTLKHVLGIVAGILIPGTSDKTASLVHSVQQHLAELYGVAAIALAKELAVDTNGMSGPDKVFAVMKAIVATAKRDGFAGDLKVLERVALDVAQTAYRAALPTIEGDMLALATSLSASPLTKVATALVVDQVKSVLHLDQPLAA